MPPTLPVYPLPSTPVEAAYSPLRLRYNDIPLSRSNADRFIQELITVGIVKPYRGGSRVIYIVPTGAARLVQDMKIGRERAQGRGALPAIRNFLRERGYPALNTDQSDPAKIVPLWKILGTGTDPKRQRALVDAGILKRITVGGQKRYALGGDKTPEEFESVVAKLREERKSSPVSTQVLIDRLLDMGFGPPTKKVPPPTYDSVGKSVNTSGIREFLPSSYWISVLEKMGAISCTKYGNQSRYTVAVEGKTYEDLRVAAAGAAEEAKKGRTGRLTQAILYHYLVSHGLIPRGKEELSPFTGGVNHPWSSEESRLLFLLDVRLTAVAAHLAKCRNKRWASILTERHGHLAREFARRGILPVECQVDTDEVFPSPAAQAVLARFREVYQEEIRLFRAVASDSTESAEWSRYLELALDNIYQDYLVEAQEVPNA